jgi:hypothetical protein
MQSLLLSRYVVRTTTKWLSEFNVTLNVYMKFDKDVLKLALHFTYLILTVLAVEIASL